MLVNMRQLKTISTIIQNIEKDGTSLAFQVHF